MSADGSNGAVSADAIIAEMSRVWDILKKAQQQDPSLPDAERVATVLERAIEQAKAARSHPLGPVAGLAHADDYDLALIRTAIEGPRVASTPNRLTGRDLIGFHKYEDVDAGWLGTVWNYVVQSKLPFPIAPRATDLVFPLADKTSIAIAGDWGTGNESSRAIGSRMEEWHPEYSIHLGDVYYSGTESEEKSRFVDIWPAGSKGSFTLNSNHEMYSGGHGYFGVALSHPKFSGQRGHSYFALTNQNWLILGLDSAYTATNFYNTGALYDPQSLWIQSLLGSPVATRSDGRKKTLILLTHHQGLEDDGKPSNPLWTQVTQAIDGYSGFWYWGHIHNVAAFQPTPYPAGPRQGGGGTIQGRLVGHGGVPYAADPKTPAMLWTEDTRANDPTIPDRARNGFAFLELDGNKLCETLVDEYGNHRWTSGWQQNS